MKTCNNCKETKEDSDFYMLWDKEISEPVWLANQCKKCKNKKEHNHKLQMQLDAGSKNIVNCEGCDRLMKRMTTRRVCLGCR